VADTPTLLLAHMDETPSSSCIYQHSIFNMRPSDPQLFKSILSTVRVRTNFLCLQQGNLTWFCFPRRTARGPRPRLPPAERVFVFPAGRA
jgi:hypothetical protein